MEKTEAHFGCFDDIGGAARAGVHRVTAGKVRTNPTVFRLKQQMSIEQLPECALLFSEQDQQIHSLNEISAILAEQLLVGATEGALLEELSNRGVEPGAVTEWVRTFLGEASRLALLQADVQSPPVHAMQTLRIGSGLLSLRYASADLVDLVAPAFAHLEVDELEADHRLDIFGDGDLLFIGNDDERAFVTPRESLAVRLKSLIVEHALATGDQLAALHAACLERCGRVVLLLGSPGAGKTILTLALLKQGFRYGSDDVSLVRRDGEVEGVAVPPGVKGSAWNGVERFADDVSNLPVHIRPDGQQVRFLALSKEVLASPGAVRAVIRLRRSAEKSAELDRISAEDGLAELFRESLSRDGRCSIEIVRALAAIVRGADCFELRYSDAGEGASLLYQQIPL